MQRFFLRLLALFAALILWATAATMVAEAEPALCLQCKTQASNHHCNMVQHLSRVGLRVWRRRLGRGEHMGSEANGKKTTWGEDDMGSLPVRWVLQCRLV